MKYLCSGSNGFIGTNLYNKLIEDGHEVRAIPRDYLFNFYSLEKYFKQMKPDVIIHLAAYGNHSFQKGLEKTVDSNINVTVNMLQASKDIPYKAFINTSTSSVDLERQTFYSATKRGAEEICKAFSQEYDKPIVTVRPYSIYGGGEADFRFIPTVIKSAKYADTFNLAPKPKHDWVYIKDFISGVGYVIDNANKLAGTSIKIGTGKDYSNQRIVDILEEIHGSKIDYKITDKLRDYDCESWVADTTAIKSLGWKPEYSIEEGLRETYAYY